MAILPFHRRRTPHTVFVLGGGGNLGAVQVGMLKALVEAGVRPDLLLGCSVGAVNAAVVAEQPGPAGVALLEEVWASLPREALGATSRMARVRLLAPRATALCGNDGLRALLAQHLTAERFEQAKVPLQVVATSLRTGRERWFSEGPLVEPVLASAALPGVLPPVAIDGEPFIDGGVVDNVPVRRAVALHPRRIVVLHVGNFERSRPEPKRPLDVVVHAFSIARNHRFVDEVAAVPDGIELLVLPGVDPGALRYNDFGRSAELIRRGYESTAGWLAARRPA